MASRRVAKLIGPGARAPEFRLPQLDGGEINLASLAAQGPVLLAFFKITCPVCQLTLPYLDGIHADGKIRVFGISQNEAEDTREFNEEFGIRFPVLLDSEDLDYPASNAYGISSVPTLFEIGADGTVSRVVEGWQKKEMVSLGARVDAGVAEWKAG